MDTIRLLIIDDNTRVRDALQATLSNRPRLEVYACDASLNAATTMVGAVAPDVVLFEPKSSDGKGLELCRRILSSELPPALVVLTTYRDEQEAMGLSELGVSRYLLKDIDFQWLYQEILDTYAEQPA